ncbi:hypothetical protein [Dyella sp. AD56]|uniref:hypothetical protein n=1 Tax=Dyella sp. AD56 TaxID=1528744 RepID=UPI001E5F0D8D|nr:hypothetical protein [Dyella sp. AD56]
MRGTWRARGAWAQAAADESQRQRFSFQWLDAAVTQAMAQQGHQRLCACVNALRLGTEGQALFHMDERLGREFGKQGFRKVHRQAGITTVEGMADLITLLSVEEQHVVGIGHRLVGRHMPQIQPTIRKDQLGGCGAFLRTPVLTGAAAVHVTQREGVRRQQNVAGDGRHGLGAGAARAGCGRSITRHPAQDLCRWVDS